MTSLVASATRPGRRSRFITWLAGPALVLSLPWMVVGMEASQDPPIGAAFADMDTLRNAVALFASERHRLPTEAEGLDVLAAGDDKLLDRVPSDPWQHPYRYRLTASGAGFEIHSSGRDGIDQHGAGDDVTTADKSYRCMDYYNDCPLDMRWWSSWAPFLLFLASFTWLFAQASIGLARFASRFGRRGRSLVRERPDQGVL
jgi:hypothetical protein